MMQPPTASNSKSAAPNTRANGRRTGKMDKTMKHKILNDPNRPAVCLQALKAHMLMAEISDHDADLQRLITVATDYFEKTYSMALMLRQEIVDISCYTWNEAGDFSSLTPLRCGVNLPVRPVEKIIEIAGRYPIPEVRALAPEDYFLRGGLNPNLVITNESSWAEIVAYIDQARIIYRAGFGNSPNDVPLLISHGLMKMIQWLWKHPKEDLETAAKRSGAASLWSPYQLEKRITVSKECDGAVVAQPTDEGLVGGEAQINLCHECGSDQLKERALAQLQYAYSEGFKNGTAMANGDDTVPDCDGGTELSYVLIHDILK